MPSARLAVRLAAALLAAALPATASAETPLDRDRLWVADGPVSALARDGQTLYLGGDFSRLSPATGGGVVLDAGGTRTAGPELAGDVLAATPDGAGGLYVAGRFQHVDGAAASIVRLRADGTVDPAFDAPSMDDTVMALAVAGPHLYVGGHIGRVGGDPAYDGLIRLDRTTGAVDPSFKPVVSGFSDYVAALAPSGGRMLVGGAFTQVCQAQGSGCVPRNFAADIDLATGAVGTWTPHPSHDVSALLVHGGAAYLGGSFDCMQTVPNASCGDGGDVAREGLAKVHLTTGANDAAFDARLAFPNGADASVRDLVADPGGGVIAVGSFSCAGWNGDADCSDGGAERVRNRLVRVDATGAADGLATGADDAISAAALVGNALWLGGSFDALGGAARAGLGAIDRATGAVLPADPSPNGTTAVLAALGERMFAGGSFTGIGGVARGRLAALDLQTGAPTAWAPQVDGPVRALHIGGGSLYAGGAFTSVDGAPRGSAAAFSLAGGALLPWNPAVNGDVYALAGGAGAVYLGGAFTGAGGDVGQTNLAAVGAGDGLARPFPDASGTVRALAAADGVLYAGGQFSGPAALGTAARSYAGAVELGSGTVTPWAPALDAPVQSLLAQATGVVLGGQFSQAGGLERRGLARVDRGPGVIDAAWNPALGSGSTVSALAADGSRLVIAGLLDIGESDSHSVARLEANGAVGAWRPDVPGGVTALAAQDGAVHLGGAFDVAGARAAGHLAGFTPAPAVLRAPAIGGAGTLTCDPGAWEGAPALSIAWLRDGAPAGTGASYAVGAADGGRALTCRVTARTIRGSASADSARVALPGDDDVARDTAAPQLSRLRLSAKRPRVKRPLALRLTASEAATATVTVQRRVVGRRKGKRCVPRRSRGRRCVAFKRVAVVRAAVAAGESRVALPRKRLARAGRYRLVVRAVDAAGNRSAPARLGFKLRR